MNDNLVVLPVVRVERTEEPILSPQEELLRRIGWAIDDCIDDGRLGQDRSKGEQQMDHLTATGSPAAEIVTPASECGSPDDRFRISLQGACLVAALNYEASFGQPDGKPAIDVACDMHARLGGES